VNEPATTITGNLTADPELRYTPTGQAVASFTIASTPRYKDTASGEWKDAETWFVRCSAWRDLGQNIAECLTKGAAVVATGKLRARSWETDDGARRTVIEMTVDDLGPSLRRAVAKVFKATREHPAPGGPAPEPDRWSTPAPAEPTAEQGWQGGEPPF
jgi:single-strand DNA-binding protein